MGLVFVSNFTQIHDSSLQTTVVRKMLTSADKWTRFEHHVQDLIAKKIESSTGGGTDGKGFFKLTIRFLQFPPFGESNSVICTLSEAGMREH